MSLEIRRKSWGWFVGETLKVNLEADYLMELEVGIGVLHDGRVDFRQEMDLPFTRDRDRFYFDQYTDYKRKGHI